MAKDQGDTSSIGQRPGGGGTALPWGAVCSPKESEEGHSGVLQPTGKTLPESAEKPPGQENRTHGRGST
jgi:hypothetical protein